jgi:hypothetical protein
VLVVICSHCENEIKISNKQANFEKSVHDVQDAFNDLNNTFYQPSRDWADDLMGREVKFKVHTDTVRSHQRVDDEIEELRRKLGRGE